MDKYYQANEAMHEDEVKRRKLHATFGSLCWKCKKELKPISPPCIYCDGCRQLIAEGKIKGVL